MKKTILAALVALSVFAAVFPHSAVYSSDTSDKYKQDIAFMHAMGFVENTSGSSKGTVSRSSYFAMLAKMICCDGAKQLDERGIIDMDRFGMNTAISRDEAAEAAVRALGYDESICNESSAATAAKIGLLKNAYSGETFTKSDCMAMLVNACEANLMQLQGFYKGGATYGTADKETVLTKYHSIYDMTGVVTGAENERFLDEENLGEGNVTIDSAKLKMGQIDAKSYLGKRVKAYYKKADATGEFEDSVLVYVKESTANKVTVLNADDIDAAQTTRRQIVWRDASDKICRADITQIADMIYNKRGYPAFTAAELTPRVGNVTLIDNSDDGNIDCIIVNAYKTLTVDRASKLTLTVSAKDTGEVVNLKNYDKYKITDTAGESLTISKLGQYSVLFVAESKSGKYAEITACSDNVKGSVSEIDYEKNEVKIDDKIYKINKTYLDYLSGSVPYETGKIKTYQLDPFGAIAYVRPSKSGIYKYGYYFKGNSEELGGEVQFKILTTSGWKTYDLAQTVECNGTGKSAQKAYEEITPRQILRYRLSSDEKIITVDTVQETTANGNDSNVFHKTILNNIMYRTENDSFDSKYYMRSVTTFLIPTGEDANNPDKYRIAGIPFADYTNYSGIEMYDLDRFNCGSIVLYNVNVSNPDVSKSSLFLVESVGAVQRDGEILQTITGVVEGQNITLTGENEEIFDAVLSGDLLRFNINADGRVNYFDWAWKGANAKVADAVLSVNLHAINAFIKGFVDDMDVNTGFIVLKGTDGVRSITIDECSIYMYDSSVKKARNINLTDIQTGDFIVIKGRQSKMKSVIVYR